MNMIWVVSSEGRESRASVRLLYEPSTDPASDTKIAPAGGVVPLDGWAHVAVAGEVALEVGVADPDAGVAGFGPVRSYDGAKL